MFAIVEAGEIISVGDKPRRIRRGNAIITIGRRPTSGMINVGVIPVRVVDPGGHPWQEEGGSDYEILDNQVVRTVHYRDRDKVGIAKDAIRAIKRIAGDILASGVEITLGQTTDTFEVSDEAKESIIATISYLNIHSEFPRGSATRTVYSLTDHEYDLTPQQYVEWAKELRDAIDAIESLADGHIRAIKVLARTRTPQDVYEYDYTTGWPS